MSEKSISEVFWSPLTNIIDHIKTPFISVKPSPVFIKSDANPKLFRPQTFEQYIGQAKAKDILKSYIKAMKERDKILPHVLIYGSAGCGKTTLAKIIANELSVKFIESITSEIKDFIDLEWKINDAQSGVLFLDEIHSLDRDTAESIYTVMEDFTHEGDPILPFTLVGATTELGEILKNRRPFYDRFKIIIELENYTPQDLSTIAQQYKESSFKEDNVPQELYDLIGRNSRGTPRSAIRLIEATIYLNNDIQRVLKNFSIIKDGFTEKDLKVLRYISKNEKGVGLQGLTSFLGTSQENYTYDIEPFLLTNELIIRTPRGRRITEEGKEKIKELENG